MNITTKFTDDKSLKMQYLQLYKEVNRKYFGASVTMEDKWNDFSHICVALNDDLVVGGCRLSVFQGDLLPMETKDFRISLKCKKNDIAELSRLIIHPHFSKYNIAEKLIMQAEKMAMILGVGYVYSIVASKQARLYSLYFQHYKRTHAGQSQFETLKEIQIPKSVKIKYPREVTSLIRIKIK